MGGRITFLRLPLSGQTYAVSVSPTDGSRPTPAQTAHIYREIERRGYSVDPNPRFASGMMAVRFEPDSSGVGGLVSIVAVQNKEANSASASRELKEQSDRALREMVREPRE